MVNLMVNLIVNLMVNLMVNSMANLMQNDATAASLIEKNVMFDDKSFRSEVCGSAFVLSAVEAPGAVAVGPQPATPVVEISVGTGGGPLQVDLSDIFPGLADVDMVTLNPTPHTLNPHPKL